MEDLVASPRWQDFCRSLAASLQVTLTFFGPQGPISPASRPAPPGGWQALAEQVAAGPVLIQVPGSGPAAAAPLGGGVGFLLEGDGDGPLLLARAQAVAEVLATFACALDRAGDPDRATVERTALREVARLVAGLLHPDRFSVRQVLDLILQCLLLLTDGLAAWVAEGTRVAVCWGDGRATAADFTPPPGHIRVERELGGRPPRVLDGHRQ